MRYLVLALLFIFSLTLQSTMFDFIKVAGVKPDFVLLLVIYYSFTNGPLKGAIFGLGIGLLEDLFLGHFIGMNALALLSAGFIAGWFETKMYKENLLIAFLVIFLTTIFSQLIIFFSGAVVGLNWTLTQSWRLLLTLAIYNTCLVPFTYPWFHHSVSRGLLRHRPKHER
jgi:rod shape-determining protein MreD